MRKINIVRFGTVLFVCVFGGQIWAADQLRLTGDDGQVFEQEAPITFDTVSCRVSSQGLLVRASRGDVYAEIDVVSPVVAEALRDFDLVQQVTAASKSNVRFFDRYGYRWEVREKGTDVSDRSPQCGVKIGLDRRTGKTTATAACLNLRTSDGLTSNVSFKLALESFRCTAI